MNNKNQDNLNLDFITSEDLNKQAELDMELTITDKENGLDLNEENIMKHLLNSINNANSNGEEIEKMNDNVIDFSNKSFNKKWLRYVFCAAAVLTLAVGVKFILSNQSIKKQHNNNIISSSGDSTIKETVSPSDSIIKTTVNGVELTTKTEWHDDYVIVSFDSNSKDYTVCSTYTTAKNQYLSIGGKILYPDVPYYLEHKTQFKYDLTPLKNNNIAITDSIKEKAYICIKSLRLQYTQEPGSDTTVKIERDSQGNLLDINKTVTIGDWTFTFSDFKDIVIPNINVDDGKRLRYKLTIKNNNKYYYDLQYQQFNYDGISSSEADCGFNFVTEDDDYTNFLSDCCMEGEWIYTVDVSSSDNILDVNEISIPNVKYETNPIQYNNPNYKSYFVDPSKTNEKADELDEKKLYTDYKDLFFILPVK